MQSAQIKNKKLFEIILVCLILMILLITFFLIAEDVLEKQFFMIDELFLNFALDIRNGFLTFVFVVITNLVNPIVLGVIAFVLLLFVKSQRRYSLALFLNLGLVSLLNLVLKTFFVRERPNVALSLISETGYSFPSGHAMLAVAFYGFLIFMVWQTKWKTGKKIGLSIFGSVLILLIGFSRIYLGVHYATDVLGAICISLFYLIIFILIVKRHNVTLKEESNDFKKHSFVSGFKYAGRGIATAFQEENNLLVQFSASMLVIVFGVTLRISMVEWCICVVMSFLVMSLELVNTSIENICDKITLEQDEKIKRIKDISAGAVLLMSICACIVAGIIFLPKIPGLFF